MLLIVKCSILNDAETFVLRYDVNAAATEYVFVYIYRQVQFKILKVYHFNILIKLNVIGFIILKDWKNKCLSICYSKSYFEFVLEN